MTRADVLRVEFVEALPDVLEPATVYVSIVCSTVAHQCCCGCGLLVITPLSRKDWRFIYDGETISLEPSIGNWSYPCRSHYWITRNRVKWAPQWSDEQIAKVQAVDRAAKQATCDDLAHAPEATAASPSPSPATRKPAGRLERFKRWIWG